MSAADEARRQQGMLRALQAGTPLQAMPPGAMPLPGRQADALAGLRAYRANAQAIAQRALAAAYPVLAQLLGEEAMAALARDLWQAHPPSRGDLAWFGAELPGWLAGIDDFADMPWLADVARLEWAVHAASGAAGAAPAELQLHLLAHADLDRLRVGFAAASELVESDWPVLTLWRAHQGPEGAVPDLRDAREALAARRGEATWVWRRGLRVELAGLDVAEAAFNTALRAGQPLGPALDQALSRFPVFSFEHWLTRALREGWLAELQTLPEPT